MNKILITACLLISTLAYAEQVTTVGNLTIKMPDMHNNWLKVYKDNKVILDEACFGACEIFSVKSKSFDFKLSDGVVISDRKTAFNLKPANITIFQTGWFNQNNVIGFVVSSAGASGLSGSQSIYTIDIESGEISKDYQDFDYGCCFRDDWNPASCTKGS